MIQTRRDKASKAPEANYTEAMCDDCRRTCRESRVEGVTRTNHDAACDEAVRTAKAAGWAERTVADRTPRKRKASLIIKLLCPECQGGEEGRP